MLRIGLTKPSIPRCARYDIARSRIIRAPQIFVPYQLLGSESLTDIPLIILPANTVRFLSRWRGQAKIIIGSCKDNFFSLDDRPRRAFQFIHGNAERIAARRFAQRMIGSGCRLEFFKKAHKFTTELS